MLPVTPQMVNEAHGLSIDGMLAMSRMQSSESPSVAPSTHGRPAAAQASVHVCWAADLTQWYPKVALGHDGGLGGGGLGEGGGGEGGGGGGGGGLAAGGSGGGERMREPPAVGQPHTCLAALPMALSMIVVTPPELW